MKCKVKWTTSRMRSSSSSLYLCKCKILSVFLWQASLAVDQNWMCWSVGRVDWWRICFKKYLSSLLSGLCWLSAMCELAHPFNKQRFPIPLLSLLVAKTSRWQMCVSCLRVNTCDASVYACLCIFLFIQPHSTVKTCRILLPCDHLFFCFVFACKVCPVALQ